MSERAWQALELIAKIDKGHQIGPYRDAETAVESLRAIGEIARDALASMVPPTPERDDR